MTARTPGHELRAAPIPLRALAVLEHNDIIHTGTFGCITPSGYESEPRYRFRGVAPSYRRRVEHLSRWNKPTAPAMPGLRGCHLVPISRLPPAGPKKNQERVKAPLRSPGELAIPQQANLYQISRWCMDRPEIVEGRQH